MFNEGIFLLLYQTNCRGSFSPFLMESRGGNMLNHEYLLLYWSCNILTGKCTALTTCLFLDFELSHVIELSFQKLFNIHERDVKKDFLLQSIVKRISLKWYFHFLNKISLHKHLITVQRFQDSKDFGAQFLCSFKDI